MAFSSTKPQFTLAEVIQAAAFTPLIPLTASTVSNYIKLGHLKAKQPGSGRRRLYSAEDAVVVAAMHHMTSVGFALSDAAEISRTFRDRVHDPKRGNVNHEPGPLRLYVALHRGRRSVVPVFDNDHSVATQAVLLELRNQPLYTCVNIDFIIDRTIGVLRLILNERAAGAGTWEVQDTLRKRAHESQKLWLINASVKLSAFEEKIKQEGRTATPEEEVQLQILRMDVENARRAVSISEGVEP
jgi:DNA-binding transcriptional MerR regulator